MTKTVIWTVPNAGADHISALKNACENDNGTVLSQPEPGGNFTVSCIADIPAPDASGSTPAGLAGAKTAVASAVVAIDPTKRDTDLSHLHPTVRDKVTAVQTQLDAESIPMKIFEGYRSPQRQAYLYAQGRTTRGPKVTNADAWKSYHQYGVAADFVRFENGNWNWNDSSAQDKAQWDRYHQIARDNGLEPLSFERPHVQLAGYTMTRLMNGDYPEGGDASWSANLTKAISGWTGTGAPPPVDDAPRPALAHVATASEHTNEGALVWRSMFGGDAWAVNKTGVYTRNHLGGLKLWRTAGAPITVQEVLARHGPAIRAASEKYDVAQALIIMTIATETGKYRNQGFTGPLTFRWEQGSRLNATGDSKLDGKEWGDYSAGPMQVMSDTARWTNNTYDLGHDNATTLRYFKNRPSPAPTDLGLYRSDVCVDIGTAYIRHNTSKTGDDPLLVAAAYNAGGLYPSSGNHWRIKSYGAHIDRAAEWYGDACFVLNGM